VRWRTWLAAGAIATAALAGCSTPPQPGGGLPLRRVSETALTGGPVRFDYTALDVERGRLIDVDVGARTVVRTLPDLPDVHGVIVVPDKHRVYATATGNNQLVAIDEDSDRVAFRAPTGTYPDGLAYDPIRRAVWTTNESAGTETVVDADTGTVRATVPLGGEVGNVVYDGLPDKMVVAVQGRNELAVIDPVSFTVTERIPTAGCDHPHGQALDGANQVMFVGCEANATMVTVDLSDRTVVDRHGVGETPDVFGLRPWRRACLCRRRERLGQHFRSRTRASDRAGFRSSGRRSAFNGSRPDDPPQLLSDTERSQRIAGVVGIRTRQLRLRP